MNWLGTSDLEVRRSAVQSIMSFLLFLEISGMYGSTSTWKTKDVVGNHSFVYQSMLK